MLGKVFKIRVLILNISIDMWAKYHSLHGPGDYTGTTSNFLDTIGLPSGMSARYNEQEKEFFEEIYKLWRKRDANRT